MNPEEEVKVRASPLKAFAMTKCRWGLKRLDLPMNNQSNQDYFHMVNIILSAIELMGQSLEWYGR